MSHTVIYQDVHDPTAPWQMARCTVSHRCYFTRREAEMKVKELLNTGKVAIVRIFDRDQLVGEWQKRS